MSAASSPVSPLIDELWAARESLTPADSDARQVVTEAVDQLDSGVARAARLEADEGVVDVGAGTLVDTWATVGSCAQIGANVHLSGGVGIGGVLEPPNAQPVVVEDDAFVGSRCMVTEGARVGRGAVLGSGTILGPTIPVIDVETGEQISRGRIPPWSVAVGGTRQKQFDGGTYGLPCVLLIKRLAEGERHDKAQLNDVLRSHGLST